MNGCLQPQGVEVYQPTFSNNHLCFTHTNAMKAIDMFRKFYIGGSQNPYLIRWFLIPRNRWFNVYLHKFCRDDDDRAMHCHPWWFASIVLCGRYFEQLNFFELPRIERKVFSFAIRRPTDRHIVYLPKDADGKPIPCWTLVFTGPRIREWGFWCPKGFVHWKQFVDSTDEGNVGRGCE